MPKQTDPAPSDDDIRRAVERRRAALYNEKARLERDIAKAETTLQILTGEADLPPVKTSTALQRAEEHMTEVVRRARHPDSRGVGVGDDVLDAIRQYFKERPGRWVRQADIDKELGINSGSVSMALPYLEVQGEIEKGGKVRRSFTWRSRRPSK